MRIKNIEGHFDTIKSELKQLSRIMRMTLFLFVACALHLTAANINAQDARLELKSTTISVGSLLSEIEKQTDYLVVYSNREVDTSREVTLKNTSDKISVYLDNAFAGTGIGYDFENNYIVLSKHESQAASNLTARIANAQQAGKTISGTIVDAKGEPIPGATIILQSNPSVGTVTDFDGKFTLNNVPENGVVVVSYIGMKSQNISVAGKTMFHVTLVDDAKMLDELVVTALGIRREEKALGYAVQKVSGETLSTVKGVSVATSLTGKIAGVNVRNSTEFGAEPSILIRGKSPLIVIDGVPYSNTTLADIASDDIADITVQKGPAASALYGSRGGNGAIMITTKRGKKDGLTVSVNSNTMYNAGHIRIPKPQTSYSSGNNGRYDRYDFVWGDKMDIGRTAVQYNPETYQWEEMPLVSKGRNNFENFLETAVVTNNNVAVAYKGKDGSIRASLNHVYNKGQYPNLQSNKFIELGS